MSCASHPPCSLLPRDPCVNSMRLSLVQMPIPCVGLEHLRATAGPWFSYIPSWFHSFGSTAVHRTLGKCLICACWCILRDIMKDSEQVMRGGDGLVGGGMGLLPFAHHSPLHCFSTQKIHEASPFRSSGHIHTCLPKWLAFGGHLDLWPLYSLCRFGLRLNVALWSRDYFSQ